MLADEMIVLEKQARSETAPLGRRIRDWDEANQRELVFPTSQMPAVSCRSIDPR